MLLAAEEKAEAEKLVKAEKAKKPEKPQIADKAKKPVAASSNLPQPGQKLGLNGKPLPPKTVVDKPKKRATEPLRKPNPGAFGDPSSRKK
jgi:hypothetical protein